MTLPREVAPGTSVIDLMHMGQPSVIAASVLEVEDGVAIVDPGPASTLQTLLDSLAAAGIQVEDVRAVLATHIHLDHAGAAGSLVDLNPEIQVYVHEIGAPHLADPSKLVRSATRLFTKLMDRLWGPCVPIPDAQINIVQDGDTITIAGRSLDVAYTPGHASHHVSYLDSNTGLAFVGDAAGGRINDGPFVVPATPPPETHIETILESLQRIDAWNPTQIVVTHFGVAANFAEHRAMLEETLTVWAEEVRRTLSEPGTDEERRAKFALWAASCLRKSVDTRIAESYEKGVPPWLSWLGLARYWRKRDELG